MPCPGKTHRGEPVVLESFEHGQSPVVCSMEMSEVGAPALDFRRQMLPKFFAQAPGVQRPGCAAISVNRPSRLLTVAPFEYHGPRKQNVNQWVILPVEESIT